MAADRAADLGLTLAELSPETIKTLNALLPPMWSHGNPVDLVGDATPERYRDALLAVAKDEGIDGILVMLSPQAMTRPLEVAQAVIEISAQNLKPMLVCWMASSGLAA